MGEWINIGDMDPKQGTSLVRDMTYDGHAFSADLVQVIPETQVGGSDRIFDINQGNFHLWERDFSSALATIGRKLNEAGDIIDNDENTLAKGSQKWLLELAYATQAFCGGEFETSTLVGISIPTRVDGEEKFEGEVTLFPAGTSLWAIMRRTCDGFDFLSPDEEEPTLAEALDTDGGDYDGTPREIRTMADLMKIAGFARLGADEDGQPKVWRHGVSLPDGRRVFIKSAHQDFSYIMDEDEMHEQSLTIGKPVTDPEILPSATTWIGPMQDDLVSAWEDFYEEPVRTPAGPGEELGL